MNSLQRSEAAGRKPVNLRAWIPVCAGVLLTCASVVVTRKASAVDERPTAAQRAREDFELMRLFAEAYEQIDSHYVREVDRRQLVDAAIRGMVSQLDPYSTWIPPQDLGRFESFIDQEFVGIGVHVHLVNGRLEVLSPLPQSPAYRAGVRSGDVLVEVDGKAVMGLSPGEVGKLLAGPVGRPVIVGIRHAGSETVEKLEIVRQTVSVPTVTGISRTENGEWKYVLEESGIAIVRIAHFSRNTGDELRKALDSATMSGMKALIIDLRSNPGGLIDAAVDVVDQFLDSGRIVSMSGRKVAERKWEARAGMSVPSVIPIAVLMNRQSASASEIVAAALQDSQRAVVVGERSFGKGSVQTVIHLEDDKSAMKLTTASYFRPSGVNIHRFPESGKDDAWGVHPDEGHVVELTKDQWVAWLQSREGTDGVLGTRPMTDVIATDLQLGHAVEWCRQQTMPQPTP